MKAAFAFLVTILSACGDDDQDTPRCVPLESPTHSDAAQAGGFVGRPVGFGRVGRLQGCQHDAGGQDCDDPSDLSNCWNPFYNSALDGGADAMEALDRWLGPCACELPPQSSGISSEGAY